jgi:hypothetical protein
MEGDARIIQLEVQSAGLQTQRNGESVVGIYRSEVE